MSQSNTMIAPSNGSTPPSPEGAGVIDPEVVPKASRRWPSTRPDGRR
jgi:hypothetical protein